MKYKSTHNLDQRISESQRIVSKYPNYVPVIIDFPQTITPQPKNKFLCPREVNFSHLICIIRKQLPSIKQSEAIFCFIGNSLVVNSKLVGEIYDEIQEKEKSHDKFLYVTVSFENTFG